MRLNFIGFLSLTIVLISLFLPWWSVTYSNLFRYQDAGDSKNFYHVSKVDYSAFFGNAMSFGVYENLTVLDSSSWTLFSTPNQHYWNPSNLTFLLTLTSIFSIVAISLGAIGCFATRSWSNQGRKMFLAMGLVFICAIFFQLWYDAQEGITVLLGYREAPHAYDIGIFGTKQIIVEDTVGVISTYPNIGFYLAVAGVVSALFAWHYPKWLHLPISESRAYMAKWLRWLKISEREKLTTLFLSSLLMGYLLVFLMVFVF